MLRARKTISSENLYLHYLNSLVLPNDIVVLLRYPLVQVFKRLGKKVLDQTVLVQLKSSIVLLVYYVYYC